MSADYNSGKRILIFLTGGTICSAYNGQNIKSACREIGTLLEYNFRHCTSEFADCVDFEVTENYGIFSENMTVELWNFILEKLRTLCKIKSYDGIIIAHGTDTLAYSSAMFSLLLSEYDIPIFFVSSNEALSEPNANGGDNFRTAVECICRGIKCGVYAAYRNISDGKMYLHYGSRLRQCMPYSEDFYSDGMLDITGNAESVINFGKAYNVRELKLPQNIKLKNDVLKIEPYVGMSYDGFCLENYRFILHTAYHSGTVNSCFTTEPKSDRIYYTKDGARYYTDTSVQHLIDRCNEGQTIVIAPAKGEGKLYDTVPVIAKHVADSRAKCRVIFACGCTVEMYYAKLILASSLGLTDTQTDELLSEEYCNEFFAKDNRIYRCERQ